MRDKQTATVAALLGASLLLLTACSGNNTTPGTPAPASPSQSSTVLPDGTPPVPAPLNPAAIQAAPCSPITPEQVTSLGLPQKYAKADGDPGSCDWSFVTGGNPATFSGSLLMNIGLQGLYSRHQTGALTKFEPFTAAGYPGVVYDDVTNPLPGDCALTVALQNNIGYTISVSLNSDNTPLGNSCELGKKVAGFVVEYLKGKS